MTRNTNAFASPALPSANNSHDGGPLHGTETPPVRFGETGWGLHTVASSSLPAQRPRNLATATIPTATPYTNAQLLGHAPAWGGAYQASAPQVRNVQQTVAQHTVAQRSVAQRTYRHELAFKTLADTSDASSSAKEAQRGRSPTCPLRISTAPTNSSRSGVRGKHPTSAVSGTPAGILSTHFV